MRKKADIHGPESTSRQRKKPQTVDLQGLQLGGISRARTYDLHDVKLHNYTVIMHNYTLSRFHSFIFTCLCIEQSSAAGGVLLSAYAKKTITVMEKSYHIKED